MSSRHPSLPDVGAAARVRPRAVRHGLAFTALLAAAALTAGCGMLPPSGGSSSSEPDSPSPASTSGSVSESASASASGSAFGSASTSASGSASSAASSPAPSGGTTVTAEGVSFTLPARWKEADLSNQTTVRLGQEPADEERMWTISTDPADAHKDGNISVATLNYRRTDPTSQPSVPVEELQSRIRDWASQTVASLGSMPPEQLGSTLQLEGVGCREGTITLPRAPRTADFGPDGAGQAIRIDYRCTAFRDPRLGAVEGHRWVTTDTQGRRIDLYLTAYEGFLKDVAKDPRMLEDILDSIRPAA